MSDDAQGKTLLATPVPKEGQARAAEPAADTLIGKELAGRYKIERKLGEGGMGSVYVAQHTTLEKPVALKILHGEYARKPDLIERFLQEAKAASKIRHENVIDITDFGITEDGLVFFCMELLSGQDLHELLTRARIEGTPIPWSRSEPIFLQVCAALHAAHQAGVIHRDLKPENIFLIEWLGNPDFVKLLDFGIAKMTSVEGSEDGRKLTKTGMLFGTPEYMSPEQARGDKPDARVDVYAMGCILYQLVTGSTPFSGDSFMAVLSQHLTAAPPVVTHGQLSAVGAPAGLAQVIAKALVKDRDVRYQTIKELADAVRQVSAGAGAAAPAPVAPADSTPVPEPVSRKSEWTGSARIPAATVEEARPARPNLARKLWMAVAAVVVIGGAAVAAIAMTRGGGGGEATEQEVSEPAPAPEPEPAAAAETGTATGAGAETATEAATEAAKEPAAAREAPRATEPEVTAPVKKPEPPVEPPVRKTCPKNQRWSDAKSKCVAKTIETPPGETEIKPGEVKTKNPFGD